MEMSYYDRWKGVTMVAEGVVLSIDIDMLSSVDFIIVYSDLLFNILNS